MLLELMRKLRAANFAAWSCVSSGPDLARVKLTATNQKVPYWSAWLYWYFRKFGAFSIIYSMSLSTSEDDVDTTDDIESYHLVQRVDCLRDLEYLWLNSTFKKLWEEFEIGDIKNPNPLFSIFSMWDGRYRPHESFLKICLLFEDITKLEYDEWVGLCVRRDNVMLIEPKPDLAVRDQHIVRLEALFKDKLADKLDRKAFETAVSNVFVEIRESS